MSGKFTYLLCCRCGSVKRRYHWHVKCFCGHEMTKKRCGCMQFATMLSAIQAGLHRELREQEVKGA